MYDLKALIEAVEAGEFPPSWRDINRAGVAHGSYGAGRSGLAWNAFNGSMDAALALFNELLPGWDYRIESVGCKTKAFVSKPKAMSWNEPSTATNPARALLLATLKAVEAQNG